MQNEKNQTEKLISHLMQGHGIEFARAFQIFGIQDLRKRLCEVRELGYRLRYSEAPSPIAPQHTVRVCHIDTPLQEGDWVRVTGAADGVFGVRSLRGKEGRILAYAEHRFLVGNDNGPFGWFKHDALEKVGRFRRGQEVCLKHGAFTVCDRFVNPAGRTLYFLEKDGLRFHADEAMLVGLHGPQ